MAGYSGTPLPAKLGIKSGSIVALVNAPPGFERTLGDLPDGVRVRERAAGSPTVLLLFARSLAELAKRWTAAAKAVAPGGRLWVVWPKKTGPLGGDLGEDEIRAHGLADGFVDYKVCAVDEAWSGLCFARRSAAAKAPPPAAARPRRR